MKRIRYTDQEIIDGIIKQNYDVLQFIYTYHFRSIKKLVEDNSGTENDAEDIFQDSLIVIFEKVRKNELRLTSGFGTYLYAIAKHHWFRILRQRQTHKVSNEECDSLINEEPGINEELVQAERKKLVIQHFKEISEDCKKIITNLVKGCTLEEITKIMGYKSVQHTKNRRLHCKKFLITSIMGNPRFKELTNGKVGKNNQIPRW